MIETLDQLPDGIVLDADLCIIGAGAAGLLIARTFLHTGTRVVLLEGGGIGATDANHSLLDGDIGTGGFRGLRLGRSKEFGGATTLWGGQCIPLDPIDFEHRPWVPLSGWPISRAELAPFYGHAAAQLGIPPPNSDLSSWQRFGLDAIDYDPDELQSITGVFIRDPDLGRRYRAELATATNIHVVLHANVTAIGTNTFGTAVTHVPFQSLTGRTGLVRAGRVVLCGGAIENARLLLLSDGIHRGGIGNKRDLVGRYLQDHPCGRTAEITTDDPRRLQDYYNLLYGRTANYLPKIALSEIAQRRDRSLNCVGRLAYEFPPGCWLQAVRDLKAEMAGRRLPPISPRVAGRLGSILGSVPGVADAMWRRSRRGLSPAPHPAGIFLESFTEQTPNFDSRVTLAQTTDRLGLRQVRIEWRLDALIGHTLRVFTENVGREFRRLGLGTLRMAPWLEAAVPRYPDVLDSYHPAGTTRMASTEADGVVDTDCQVFGVQGLFVAGSSVFPTSGAANPTLSIAAVALRLAEHIRTDLARTAVLTLGRTGAEGAVAKAA